MEKVSNDVIRAMEELATTKKCIKAKFEEYKKEMDDATESHTVHV